MRSLFVCCVRSVIMSSQSATIIRKRQSSDLAAFRAVVSKARNVVILTGAGVSAESGVPTFRGAGGYWRHYQAQDLASPIAFRANPSLVWEFYHYRREVVKTKQPNKAHLAIAELEERFSKENKNVCVVTQNIDELHVRAGTKNIIELHGTLFKTQCTCCQHVAKNYDSPICEALAGRGAPDKNVPEARIAIELLPKCTEPNCGGLLRPYVVWFGESLNSETLCKAESELEKCDLCIVVGTSAIVYPAAMFAPQVAARGVPVAEFNIEPTPNTLSFDFYFEGPCGLTLPPALMP
uniref:NAD-dependent protein deacylase n=1 Tax=Strigamia maritima TaxID=126957 RepID=T1JM32_STRMM